MYSLPFSMYADCVTLEIFKTGQNNAGAYTGYFTFTYNLANSVALLIIGFLLDIIKFDSTQPVQALSVQNGLALIVFFGCTIFLSLAIMVFSKFSIKRSDVLKVQMVLDREHKTCLDGNAQLDDNLSKMPEKTLKNMKKAENLAKNE